jgi:hypothetical protein
VVGDLLNFVAERSLSRHFGVFRGHSSSVGMFRHYHSGCERPEMLRMRLVRIGIPLDIAASAAPATNASDPEHGKKLGIRPCGSNCHLIGTARPAAGPMPTGPDN